MKHAQLLAVAALMVIAATMSACGTKIQNAASDVYSNQDQSIVGGAKVSADDLIAKSTVALAHRLHGVFCTATLIAKNLVVTAGHCTGLTKDPRNLVVVFSRTPWEAKPEEMRRVLGGKAHDLWPQADVSTVKGVWGDVAVLRFQGSAPEGYQPAAILGNPAHLKEDMDVILAGYGMTSMVPEKHSDDLLKTTVKLSNPKLTDLELLFKQHEGRGACHGDSGGPAFVTVNGKLLLAGVTSRAATEMGGATCLEGSIYTSVAAVKDFLVAAAKHLNSPEFKQGQEIPQPEEPDRLLAIQ